MGKKPLGVIFERSWQSGGRKYLPQQLEEHICLTALTFYHSLKAFDLAVVLSTSSVHAAPGQPSRLEPHSTSTV